MIVLADRLRFGRPISQFDPQIRAIALSRGSALATRNTPDFDACCIRVVDPWQD